MVRARLRALRERDSALDRWLRDGWARPYDAMQAEAFRGIAAEQVAWRLKEHHAARLKDKRGA